MNKYQPLFRVELVLINRRSWEPKYFLSIRSGKVVFRTSFAPIEFVAPFKKRFRFSVSHLVLGMVTKLLKFILNGDILRSNQFFLSVKMFLTRFGRRIFGIHPKIWCLNFKPQYLQNYSSPTKVFEQVRKRT